MRWYNEHKAVRQCCVTKLAEHCLITVVELASSPEIE